MGDSRPAKLPATEDIARGAKMEAVALRAIVTEKDHGVVAMAATKDGRDNLGADFDSYVWALGFDLRNGPHERVLSGGWAGHHATATRYTNHIHYGYICQD